MRKQIAAANWKMNLSLREGEQLVNDLLATNHTLSDNQLAIFAVPFPYLVPFQQKYPVKKMHPLRRKIVLNIHMAHIPAK